MKQSRKFESLTDPVGKRHPDEFFCLVPVVQDLCWIPPSLFVELFCIVQTDIVKELLEGSRATVNGMDLHFGISPFTGGNPEKDNEAVGQLSGCLKGS